MVLKFAFAAAALVTLGSSAVAQDQAVQPGEWTITTTIQSMAANGLPPAVVDAMKQPTTSQTCVTPDKAALGFKAGMKRDADCPTKTLSISGGVLDAEAVCKADGGARTLRFHGPYSPTGYNLSVSSTQTGTRPSTMTMTLTAIRIGECR